MARTKKAIKNKIVTFRVTDEMYSDFEAFAEKRNLSISELVLSALRHYTDREYSSQFTYFIFSNFSKELQTEIIVNESRLPESMQLYTYAVAQHGAHEQIKEYERRRAE